jgi:hypothetical protein
MKKKSDLNQESLLTQLEELTETLGVKTRYDKINKEGSFFSGGLCKVKGQDMIIINSKSAIEDKIEILATALRSFDLSQVFIKPALREFLGQPSAEMSEDQSDEQP